MKISGANTVKTDGFRSKWGFILSGIGSAVGMGNVWRFPIQVSEYGGLTFLLPYFFFVVLIASTGVMGEYALGRAMQSGPVGAFGNAMRRSGKSEKLGKGLASVPVVSSVGTAIGYTCIVAWVAKYMFMALTGSLGELGQNMDAIWASYNDMAGANGATLWIIAVALICVLIMSFRVSRGIETTNKVLMPLLFAIFIVLCIYISTLDGASAGYRYILSFSPKRLLEPMLWVSAFGQAFFSLSVFGYACVIYGSYLGKDESIPFSAANVAIFDTVAALLAAFTVLPAMASSGADPSKGGPELMFVYLVNVFNGMPGGKLIALFFFIAVLFAAITSVISVLETPIALFAEKLKCNRRKAALIVIPVITVLSILVQPIVTGEIDLIAIYVGPLGAFLAGVMVFWVCGRDVVEAEVSSGRKKRIGRWFYTVGRYVYCPLTLAALVLGILFGGIG